jgi:DNA-binding XRE family transcriptional regulator
MSTQKRTLAWKNHGFSSVPGQPGKNGQKKLAIQVGQKIAVLRADTMYSQRDLAWLIDSSQSTIARLEAGQNLPSLRVLQNVVFALNRTITIEIAPQTAH